MTKWIILDQEVQAEVRAARKREDHMMKMIMMMKINY